MDSSYIQCIFAYMYIVPCTLPRLSKKVWSNFADKINFLETYKDIRRDAA